MNIKHLVNSNIVDDKLWRPDWTISSERDSNAIWLDKNENIDPELKQFIMGICLSIDGEAIYGYPDTSVLYSKLATFLKVGSSNLLLSHGSDGVIRSVFEAFISPGDKVLLTSPTFMMYEVYSQIYGADTIKVDYVPSVNGPVLKVEQLIEAINVDHPKLFCLPNPDSPTGAVFSKIDLEKIISACAENDVIVLVDEAYYPFCEVTALPWIKKYSNLVISRTFAKAWGLAGLRIGYAVGGNEIISFLHKVRPMYEVNSWAVAVTDKLLDYSEEISKSIDRLNVGKAYFLASMNDNGYQTINGAGNFAHVKFGSKAGAIHEKLNNKVLYRKEFKHISLAGYSRFSSAPLDLMKTVADIINS